MESTVQDVLKKNLINLFSSSSTSADILTEYELKHKLYDMMQKSRSFLAHEKHLVLYNALINSMDIDEANAKGDKDTKKRRHDHQDPPADADKDIKKRKRKDSDTSLSKKGKDQSKSSKEAKAPSKPSATKKVMDDEKLIQDDAVDDEEPKDVVVRPKTPDPNWFKEPNANDAPEQNWFNELINAKKDLKEFYDLMGSTIDFTNKPLPLQGPTGRKTIPVEFFFNKDLEYLETGNKEKKLHLNDIEDIFLMYVQNKLHHLKGHEQVDLINALRLFTRRIILKKWVEDVQLGVESYQMKLNITMPQITCAGIEVKEPYTIMYKPRGVVYLNKSNLKISMRGDELYKFSDGMLKSDRDTLNPILHNFVLGYNNECMLNRAWSEKDQKRTTLMLEKIDKTLLER
ncbi:hypothetical protein Tco_0464256 [Tanacetum coccineum]